MNNGEAVKGQNKMGIFHASRDKEMSVEKSDFISRGIDFADDIKEIHRTRGNIDIRQLHPEMTEQEAVDYLHTLITRYMPRF